MSRKVHVRFCRRAEGGDPLRLASTEMLLFRDYLRQHPEAMEAYYRLKQDLAREHGPNGQRYVDGKRAFVHAVVEQARREVSHTRTEQATYHPSP
jgi:GrpB-like predicted nucleotidyltransferase (UPF0157 family)